MNENNNFCVYDNSYYEEFSFARGEVAMWRAVIMQALLDCHTLSKRSEDILAKNDALKWFSIVNPAFIKVCKLAQMDPADVLQKSNQAIQNGCKWRDDKAKQLRVENLKKVANFNSKIVSFPALH